MARIKDVPGNRLQFDCPGCGEIHQVLNGGPNGWGFNGNYELPTITPSILAKRVKMGYRCHLFVTDGKARFLTDCSHENAGKTLDLPELETDQEGVDDDS